MAEIAPAILCEDLDSYKERIDQISPFAHRVHIDITDGEFAPNVTVNANDVYWPAGWKVDIHAMMTRPSEHVRSIVAKKPHLIVFHAEAQEDLSDIIKYVRNQGIRAGIALLKPTVPEVVRSYIEIVDHVMIFSGTLGQHGGEASMMQLEKIRLVKRIRTNVEIGWDGGVSVENAFTLVHSGVDVLNVGGAIAKSANAEGVYGKLVKEINKKGVI
jgi:ribulose-phosphate 3-epimerase